MKNCIFLVIFCIAAPTVIFAAVKFDAVSRLQGCTKSGQTFDMCLSQLLEDVRPHLKNGIPELNVPVLEPIFWKNLEFRQKNGSIDIKARFHDVNVHGFSTYSLDNLRTNAQRRELKIDVYIPVMDVDGLYNLDGKLIFLPVKGSGPFTSVFYDIEAQMVSRIVIKKEGAKERLGVTDTKINFKLSRAVTDLQNLFDGDPVLGETVNHFLNTNDQLIIDEVRPFLSRDLAQLIEVLMDSAMTSIPVEAIYPNSTVAR